MSAARPYSIDANAWINHETDGRMLTPEIARRLNSLTEHRGHCEAAAARLLKQRDELAAEISAVRKQRHLEQVASSLQKAKLRDAETQRDELLAACRHLLLCSGDCCEVCDEIRARCQPAQTSVPAHDPEELLRSHTDLFHVARRFEAWLRAEIAGETHDDQERLAALPGIAKAVGRGARFASDEDCQPGKGSQ